MLNLRDKFEDAARALMDKGLIASAHIGSPALASLFFGKTSYEANAEALAIAADKKHYAVTDMMLTTVGNNVFARNYYFDRGAAWNRFEETARKDHILERQFTAYNWKYEQAYNSLGML
jgi:hypothetical protein